MTRHRRGPKLCCMLPRGAVLRPGERFAGFAADRASGASYGQGRAIDVPFPILPLMPFGLTYELDLVFMTKHPSWNMHEYALIRTSAGLVWLLKDAREGTMEQTIIADVDAIDDWMPEVPVQRRRQAITVDADLGAERIRVDLAYDNWDGDRTEAHFAGRFPRRLQRKRNGSTMRHSQGQLLAVLDLSHQDLGRGHVSIGGVRQKPARIFGVPVTAALQQTQGGLVTGRWTQSAVDGGMRTTFAARSGAQVPRDWTVRRLDGSGVGPASTWAVQDDADRQLAARYLHGADGALELRELRAWQKGQSAAGFALHLSPALPDLRREFAGEVRCRWVGDVAGQLAHATGTITARWTPDGPEVEVRPERPWWVWDRPLRASVRSAGAGVAVSVDRIPTVGRPPSNRRCTWPVTAPSGVSEEKRPDIE